MTAAASAPESVDRPSPEPLPDFRTMRLHELNVWFIEELMRCRAANAWAADTRAQLAALEAEFRLADGDGR